MSKKRANGTPGKRTASEPARRNHILAALTDVDLSHVLSGSDTVNLTFGHPVGAEGMMGTSLLFGVQTAPLHTVVQGTGSALRLGATRFGRELARGPGLRAIMNRYLYVTLSQVGQMVACTRFHTVDERLARWLLMTRDRAQSDAFHMTHEYMALMLGVRRVG